MAIKGEGREKNILVQMALLTVVFLVCFFSAVTVLTPQRYNVIAGDTAQENIVSPQAVENEYETELRRTIARNSVKEVLELKTELVGQYTADADKFFSDISEFRRAAAEYRSQRAAQAGVATNGVLSINEWKTIVTNAEMQEMLLAFDLPISLEEGWWLLHVEESDITRLNDAVLSKIKTALASGLEESQLEARQAAYIRELNATSIADSLKSVGEKVLTAYLKPTYVVDAVKTLQEKEVAASSVEPVMIQKGDVIVGEGETITQQQYELLREMELVRADNADLQLDIGLGVYMLCICLMLFFYLLFFQKQIFYNRKSMVIIAVAIVLPMVFSLAAGLLDRRISASLIGVLLVALLVDRKTAMVVNVVLAFCIGLLAGGRGASMLGFDSMVMTLSVFIGGQAAIFYERKYYKRGSVVMAGLFAGIASSLVVLSAYIMTAKTLGVILLGAAWSLGSNLIGAVLVVGTLSLWEHLFDAATSARLNELSNANNPLLRQLMTEAAGTYHHSMMVASLSEAAAEAIDADALLARVGAYFHDVGKLKRPLYFKENQKPNENIHDTLPPGESATTIIAHQKDGVTMLLKNKFPTSVIQIAYEHHGNTQVAYFYHKATQQSGGLPVNQKLFRYPGTRPSTKESAIVMLADSCEAAVRSLNNPGKEAIENLVDKIIKGKIDDMQLNNSPLTFKEVSVIRSSFLRTFNGMMHERIAYPEQKKEG